MAYSAMSQIWVKLIQQGLRKIDDPNLKEPLRTEVMKQLSPEEVEMANLVAKTQPIPVAVTMPAIISNEVDTLIEKAETLVASVPEEQIGVEVPKRNITWMKSTITKAKNNPTKANIKTLKDSIPKFQAMLDDGK